MSIGYCFAQKIMQAELYGAGTADLDCIKVNSQIIQSGDIFWALPGAKTHGGEFIKDALNQGASGIVISQEYKDIYLIECSQFHNITWALIVKDTLEALHILAHAWRNLFNIPIIGITGTAGKTTTKELFGAFFSEKLNMNVLLTKDSQNGLIGAPLTILRLRKNHNIAIIEMGISQENEMEKLSWIAQPTLALITLLGNAHLAGYHSKYEILVKEKFKITKFMQLNNINKKKVFINNDHNAKNLIEHIKNHDSDITYYGFAHGQWTIKYDKNHAIISSQDIIEEEFATSCILSKTICSAFLALYLASREFKKEKESIEFMRNYQSSLYGRFEICKNNYGKAIIINDAYNANPDSFLAGLKTLDEQYYDKDKILILGDMKELGDDEQIYHDDIALQIALLNNIKKIFVCGELLYKSLNKHALLIKKVTFFNNHLEMPDLIFNFLDLNCVIYLKASKSFNLHNISLLLQEKKYKKINTY